MSITSLIQKPITNDCSNVIVGKLKLNTNLIVGTIIKFHVSSCNPACKIQTIKNIKTMNNTFRILYNPPIL